MKDIEYLVTVRDGKSRHRTWLTGLTWAPREKRAINLSVLQAGKARHPRMPGIGVHIALGRVDARGTHSGVEGRGRLPGHQRHHQLYSLAQAFSVNTRSGYGIYRLNSTDYVFLASINGLPAVTADKAGPLSRMQELRTLFLTLNEAPPTGWEVRAELDSPEDVHSLLSSLSSRDRRSCRVEMDGLRGKRWLPAVTLLLVIGATVAWWQHEQPAPVPELTAEEIQARARAMFAKPAPPPVMPHPWASIITVPALLAQCQTLQSPAPTVLEGWGLASGTCSPEGVTLLYRIKPGGTAEGFLKRCREVFGVTPIFNLKEGAREATVPLPLPEKPLTDETVPDASGQLMRVLSWFQRQQVMLNLSEVPPAPVLPGKNGEPPSVQDWKDYAFSFSGQMPPADLFDGLDDTGVRLTRVTFELNGSAFSYTTEGHIYASSP
ncbi:type 4b pilus protein PilO2 [Phytobacter diazotrophicus]|uniref:type 4b pilus protein PilO2 n=1 Tax=Phytobacter diazotrophicus TaxID=395631 RepID=UPI001C993070|nr:type 4b pilus protein PilO2 [Phytobacter diazotrophicus]MBY6260027.1 type 4b pilus protein PilO2 [Phytobacter diazotrophicus]